MACKIISMSTSGSVVKHKTIIIFAAVIVLSLASVTLILVSGKDWLPIIGVSIVLAVFSIYKSEKDGFIRSKEIRRSYEPPRHFNSGQVLTIIVLIMAQIGVAAYALLT
ncbi:MAG: hypothetical protein HKN43_05450 [Rhodothermales bacterium]|nr:hypothetical protein [Rhodothermales bacterium]